MQPTNRTSDERLTVTTRRDRKTETVVLRDRLPPLAAGEIRLSVDKVRNILKIMQEPISLTTPVGEEEDSCLEDFLEDQNNVAPSESAVDTLRRQEVERALATLSEREAEIIRLRFGIGTGYPRTLEELGRIFNVTRERVRQIEAKAIRKLKHPSRSDKLRTYLDNL